MQPYQHILLATDLSESSQTAVDKAMALQQQSNAKLTLVHIVEPVPTYGYPGFTDFELPHEQEAKKQLAKLGEQLKVPTEQQQIALGSVKHQVIKIAEELKVDLIIIGSHGRHGFSRLLGSSAHAIVQGAPCDVLTVRCVE